MSKYDIAAYIWPSYTGDEPRTRMFWPEGMGEWQSVRSANAFYEGHLWPRKPLWGYVNEADRYVMEMEIASAVDHGVNTFIYDWYWYDNRPFLENCLNDGFLKAKNRGDMKFYLMWANHDATTLWDKRLHSTLGEVKIWDGRVNREQFETVCHRIIEKYFTQPNYYKINDCPVFMIYHLQNLIDGLGGIKNTCDAIEWFRNETVKYGLKGLHLQHCMWSRTSYTDCDGTRVPDTEVLKTIGFDSMSNYQFVHYVNMDSEYSVAREKAFEYQEENRRIYDGITFYPHVSLGWDNNPRRTKFAGPVVKNNTPEEIEKALVMAKNFADKYNNGGLITVNSWNEWTETSYLEPDDLYGYGYLEAIKKVFG